ncbi:Uncharacterised protein [Bacteroides xylanisolvens]|nr:Uncharacterised protein [Bacteroides xylanisolvens]
MTVRKQLLIRLSRFFGSAKDRTDPREQLHDAERLRHIVIRSAVKPFYDIELTCLRCHHDDRDRLHGSAPRRSHFLQNGQPILARKHDIKEQHVRYIFLQRIIQRIGITKAFDLVPLPPECITHQLANTFIIFYTVN